jgi:hypothetical protein
LDFVQGGIFGTVRNSKRAIFGCKCWICVDHGFFLLFSEVLSIVVRVVGADGIRVYGNVMNHLKKVFSTGHLAQLLKNACYSMRIIFDQECAFLRCNPVSITP